MFMSNLPTKNITPLNATLYSNFSVPLSYPVMGTGFSNAAREKNGKNQWDFGTKINVCAAKESG